MVNVDLHSHVIPPAILDAARRKPERFGIRIVEKNGKLGLERPGHHAIDLLPAFYDVEAKIESMDRMKLDIAALSVAPPAFFYSLSPEAGLAAARLSNDGIAQMVTKHPNRRRGMATLPMQDPDAAIVELERVAKEHGFKAVELGTSIEGRTLADPKFRMRRPATVEKPAAIIDEAPPALERHIARPPVRIEPGESFGPVAGRAGTLLDDGRALLEIIRVRGDAGFGCLGALGGNLLADGIRYAAL